MEQVFWSMYLPRAGFSALDKRCSLGNTGNLYELYQVAGEDTLVRLACNASFCACVGRIKGNDSLSYYGSQLYGQALRSIGRLLDDPTKCKNDNVLASCRLISLFELFRRDPSSKTSTQASDWRNHVAGMCRLVEIRGSEAHSNGLARVLLRETRLLAVRSTMSLRAPTFLAARSWRLDLIQEEPLSLEDELIDLMLQIPCLQQRLDTLTGSSLQQYSGSTGVKRIRSLRSLSDAFLVLGEKLRSFERKAVSAYHCIRDELSVATFASTSMSSSYGYIFLANHYWTACMVLYSQAHLLSESVPQAHERPGLPTWMDPLPYASLIIKNALSFSSPQAGIWGTSHGSFPLGSAINFYAAHGGIGSEENQILKSTYNSSHSSVVKEFIDSFTDGRSAPELS